MKIVFSITVILFFFGNLQAQSKTISKVDYEQAFQFAVTETNADYPLIFTVITEFIETSKIVRTVTEINENESHGHYRIRKVDITDGRETNKYQLTVGFGNVFCSDDNVFWKSSKYECFGPTALYGRRDTESVDYSVTAKTLRGKKIKIYREYTIFAPSEGNEREFNEKISTIDSRGFFITVEDIEGTLEPKTITLIRKQSWTTKAKIKKVVAPNDKNIKK
ncbi:MAG TPA: hypothetical protein PKE69_10075 [Pyrinomonadaceae bacterium]|nr:hypothetical protein [Pyrinomonadaceae bacterium]